MKDPVHHRKQIQKKVLKEARQTTSEERKSSQKEYLREEGASSRNNPEYEGERFDPHHRKPRLLKRINYH